MYFLAIHNLNTLIISTTIFAMCGIHVVISTTPLPPLTAADSIPGLSESTSRRLRARGPDHCGQVRVSLPLVGGHGPRGPDPTPPSPSRLESTALENGGLGAAGSPQPSVHICLTSTVLSLRGGDGEVTAQPFVSPLADIEDAAGGEAGGAAGLAYAFCWNGEAWSIDRLDGDSALKDVGQGGGLGKRENDGAVLFRLVRRAAATRATPSSSAYDEQLSVSQEVGKNGGGDGDVLGVLRRIRGPFAFVFLDAVRRRLYYGRDRLGRRSLVMIVQRQHSKGFDIRLSSFAEDMAQGWKEVPARGVHVLHLDQLMASMESAVETTPWLRAQEENMVSGSFTKSTLSKPPPTLPTDRDTT